MNKDIIKETVDRWFDSDKTVNYDQSIVLSNNLKKAIKKELDKMDIELYENSDGCECKTIIKKRLGLK